MKKPMSLDMALPSVEDLPSIKELPDPFVFLDGTRVQTRAEWERRREEIKQIVQHYAYGDLPLAEGEVSAEEIARTRLDEGNAEERHLLLRMGPGEGVKVRLILTVPAGDGPFPAIVVGDLGWSKLKPEIVSEVAGRGYLLAEFDRTEVVPDSNDRTTGLYSLYPQPDFGALIAWAWGFHRVIDYLVTLPEVDRSKIAVTGHSRGGKAALLAGAFDDRVVLTAPNNSGCMGAGCTRFPHDGESLEAITRVFPYWFGARLASFVGHEDRLPFDQHTVKALCAPRTLLSTEGLEDHWANPPGTQITFLAARKVYEWLDSSDKIGIVFRPGGHGHTLPDWLALLDFADEHLLGQPSKRRFDETLPFPSAETR